MSFNIALSGLKATTEDLNTISNNIANSSTVGFRSGRSEFASIYNGGAPGGVSVANTSQNFSLAGSLTYSGRELDMGIQGEGFFMTSASDGTTLYTRAGQFNQDALGFITDPAGNKLQGYSVSASGILQTGNVTDLQIQTEAMKANPTTNVKQVSNLDSRVSAITAKFNPDDPSSYHSSGSVTVYDSLGNEHVMTQYYVKNADSTWNVHYTLNDQIVTPASGPHVLKFDTSGQLIAGDSITFNALPVSGDAELLNLSLDYSGFSQYAANYNNSSLSQDGFSAGDLSGIRLADDGSIFGVYTNGQERLQGQVVLVDFANPNGLEPASNNSWIASQSAGAPVIGAPASGTLGSLKGSYLEASNVDSTTELVSLMTAQRNYQSNAKVLETNSTMQQALMNAI